MFEVEKWWRRLAGGGGVGVHFFSREVVGLLEVEERAGRGELVSGSSIER